MKTESAIIATENQKRVSTNAFSGLSLGSDLKDKKIMKAGDSQRSDILKMKMKESKKTLDLEELTSNLPREEWNMSHVKGG